MAPYTPHDSTAPATNVSQFIDARSPVSSSILQQRHEQAVSSPRGAIDLECTVGVERSRIERAGPLRRSLRRKLRQRPLFDAAVGQRDRKSAGEREILQPERQGLGGVL